jgi:hypothetical protein
MKSIKIAIIAFVLALVSVSCSKSSDSPAAAPVSVDGVWVGKFGTDNSKPTVFFSLNFKAGGVLEEIAQTGEVKGKGTWKLDNNIIYGSYAYTAAPNSKYSIIGAFDSKKGQILGNWGYGTSSTNGGLWEMTK